MARSSRSSAKKANNQRKAAGIFGPVEAARAERLSARLLEIANQPKPESSDVNMDVNDDDDESKKDSANADDAPMEVDGAKPKARIAKKRVDKRRMKKASVVFPKYSDRLAARKKKSAAAAAAK